LLQPEKRRRYRSFDFQHIAIEKMVTFPFDPLCRAKEVENLVMKGMKRKYYRLRPAKYYRGIATADLVGCNLLCAYCWNYRRNLKPSECEGRYYDHKEIAMMLIAIARRRGFNRIRLSGAEPILGERSFNHLLGVLEEISSREPTMEFILETNGLLLGTWTHFAQKLSQFQRLMVRISLKGWDSESFEKISGAQGSYFEQALRGLTNVRDQQIEAWPAIMYDLFGRKGLKIINARLKELSLKPEDLELEYLEAYPFVVENLRRRSLEPHILDAQRFEGR
jgi:uncharacterized Fe-S cluster-containing radical SAM superfamily protein